MTRNARSPASPPCSTRSASATSASTRTASPPSATACADLDALADTGLLKSEHFLHLRCELPAADMIELFDPVADHPRVRMVSLMDHTPGVGQYANLDRYRAMRRREGMPP